MARLMDQLFDRYRVALVAFDVVFAEPEETSGLQILDELDFMTAERPDLGERFRELREDLDHDGAFARSIAGRPVILGYFFTDPDASGEVNRVGALPDPVFRSGHFAGRRIPWITARVSTWVACTSRSGTSSGSSETKRPRASTEKSRR